MSRGTTPAPRLAQTPDAVTDAGLGVHEVSVSFGTTLALAPIDLAVAPGEIVGLLGASGSGKSTLLRVIAGLQRPTTGTVTWDGRDLAAVPPHQRGFGLVFQDGQLFVHRDVRRNIAYGLEVGGVARAERDRRVADLLQLVGLAGFENRAVATLSGGERQRVALARSLAPQPRLLLLDEPLSALDRDLREHLASELRGILTAAGTTAIFVTHDAEEARTVCDRVVSLGASDRA